MLEAIVVWAFYFLVLALLVGIGSLSLPALRGGRPSSKTEPSRWPASRTVATTGLLLVAGATTWAVKSSELADPEPLASVAPTQQTTTTVVGSTTTAPPVFQYTWVSDEEVESALMRWAQSTYDLDVARQEFAPPFPDTDDLMMQARHRALYGDPSMTVQNRVDELRIPLDAYDQPGGRMGLESNYPGNVLAATLAYKNLLVALADCDVTDLLRDVASSFPGSEYDAICD